MWYCFNYVARSFFCMDVPRKLLSELNTGSGAISPAWKIQHA